MLPNIPTHIVSLNGRVTVSEKEIICEIERVTGAIAKSVRHEGKTKFAAPYRTRVAYFDSENAPHYGFRLFENSRRAYPKKQWGPPVVCIRCQRLHLTGGCFRALVCGKCGFTMRLERDCKAPIKCRNCGGPHRSDSRNYLARPTRAGAPSKLQLQTIRNAGQRESTAIKRAKAAVEKARASSTTPSQPSSAPIPAASVLPTDATPCL